MNQSLSERCCPRCQASVDLEALTCQQCGYNLVADSETMGDQPTMPAPQVGESFGTLPAMEVGAAVEDAPLSEGPTEVQETVPEVSPVMPGDPFAPPPPPWMANGAAMMAPAPAPAAPRRKLSRKAVLIVLAALIVLVSGGGLAYILTRPHPVISATSAVGSGSSLTGSPDVVLHISGQDFTANSVVVFLLDGTHAPGAAQTQSDPNGNIQADVTITDDWTFGTHVLTARDAKDYQTKAGITIKVIPAPVLAVGSNYQKDSKVAGSQATLFHLSGKRFAPNASVTLLLDGSPLAGVAAITSDGKGRFEQDITTSSAWALGDHTLTAKDSQGNSTKVETELVIVPQGQAGTPGPNGAPADNATFSLMINVTERNGFGDQGSFTVFLTIRGQPDPAGGMPCASYDNGQPQTFQGDLGNGLLYKQTDTYTCSGSYKSGKLTYTEILLSRQYSLSNGDTCTASNLHFPLETYGGTFSSSTSASGTYSANGLIVGCRSGRLSLESAPASGTWTATN